MATTPALYDDDIPDYGLPPGMHKMTEAEFEAFIQEGEDELDRGEGIPHTVVMAELTAKFG